MRLPLSRVECRVEPRNFEMVPEACMKRALNSMLLAGVLVLGALAASAGGAWAQAAPEADRGAEAPRRAEPSEQPPGPQQSEDQPPSEERPSAQDQGPPMPGCPDQGRRLELIV
jgi:hypothetical protein